MALVTVKNRVSTKPVFNGEIIDVRLDTLQLDTGKTITREIVEHIGGVCIVCKPAPDEILLISQYRYSVDKYLIEIPAGRLDPGEDRLEAAKRELIEETGYRAERWELLANLLTAPGFCNELLTCHLATELTFVGKNLDEDEETDVMHVKLKDAWQMVLDGKITDCKTIAALGIVCHM